jgi:hypothetical protein
MTPLYVPSQSTASSTLIVLTNSNDAVAKFSNSASPAIVTSCRRRSCDLASPADLTSCGLRSLSSSATQSARRSRLVQITPSRPPSRSTRAISGTARPGSSQCQADDTNTPSALASGTGMASPRPAMARTPGDRAASTSRMRSSGSTAMTCPALRCSARVKSPVPAARSMATWQSGGTSQSSASSGGLGRTRS